MTRGADPDRDDIRCVLPAGAGRVVMSGWPGLRIAPTGAAWIDPEGAATTLDGFRAMGVGHLLALCERRDLPAQALAQLRAGARRRGLRLLHVPIRDYQAPDARFLRLWRVVGPAMHRRLDQGFGVALACSFGAGRSGTVAALILHERGCPMPEAMRQVRAGFHPAIESAVQEGWLRDRAGLSAARPST